MQAIPPCAMCCALKVMGRAHEPPAANDRRNAERSAAAYCGPARRPGRAHGGSHNPRRIAGHPQCGLTSSAEAAPQHPPPLKSCVQAEALRSPGPQPRASGPAAQRQNATTAGANEARHAWAATSTPCSYPRGLLRKRAQHKRPNLPLSYAAAAASLAFPPTRRSHLCVRPTCAPQGELDQIRANSNNPRSAPLGSQCQQGALENRPPTGQTRCLTQVVRPFTG